MVAIMFSTLSAMMFLSSLMLLPLTGAVPWNSPPVVTATVYETVIANSPVPTGSITANPPQPADSSPNDGTGRAIVHNYCPFHVYMFTSRGSGGGGEVVGRPQYGSVLSAHNGYYEEGFKPLMNYDTAFHFDLEPHGPQAMQFEFSLGPNSSVYYDFDVEKGDPLFAYGYSVVPTNPMCPQAHCAANTWCQGSFHTDTDGHVATCAQDTDLHVNLCKA